jgi:1-acyl-sn-glycerol-3-phosphate acyltransferase
VLAQARIVLWTAKISLATVADAALGRLDRETVDRRLKRWGQAILDIAEMTLDVRGRDAVDWSQAYIVMSNHQSLIDIPVVAVTVPGSLRFVAKKELFRVPVWGSAMRAAGIISIDRANRDSAIASLRGAGDSLRSGVHIWIAPEGTRSLDGHLGTLKKGGFVLAMETGTPILPVVIDGTRHARKKHVREIVKGVHATVTFGQPIPVAGKDRDALMREVESFFRAGLSF